MFGYLGVASFAGLAIMIILIPINAVLSTRLRRYQFANMKTKDKRIRFATGDDDKKIVFAQIRNVIYGYILIGNFGSY